MRDILTRGLPKAQYVTFDSRAAAVFAQENPETFLADHEGAFPLIIDEAQKAPNVFDAVKRAVDLDPRPGRCVLLGSTEFSHRTKVRESLTGRMGRVRLYPMTLAETLDMPSRDFVLGRLFPDPPRITRAQLLKHVRAGGMPGMFAIRDESERARLAEDWLELTCERDAMQIPGIKVDPGLCYAILEQVARLDEPSVGAIAKALKRDARRVQTHVSVLETLFVLQKLDPHPGGSGKPLYFLLDTSLAGFLGATFEKCLLTLVKKELDALLSYHDVPFTKTSYYRSRGGGLVHFVIENPREIAAVKILNGESLDLREIEILKSFRRKAAGRKVRCYALGGLRASLKEEKVEVHPWESVG